MYYVLFLTMIINDYIDIGIVVVIVIIIHTNPRPICNVFYFTSMLKNKDWNKKVVLRLQTPFYSNN